MKSSQIIRIVPLLGLFWFLVPTLAVGQATQERPALPPGVFAKSHLPRCYCEIAVDPVSSRINAVSQRIETIGNYFKSIAEANLINEEVHRRKIENRLYELQTFYEMRRTRQQAHEELADYYLESKKRAMDRKSERLAELPTTVVASAPALNDLLDRLQFSALDEIENIGSPVPLPANIMEDLRISYGTGDKKAKALLAESADPLSYQPPVFLKMGDFKDLLDEYQVVRDSMIQAIRSGKEIPAEHFEKAFDLVKQMDLKVVQTYQRKWSSNTDPKYLAYKQCNQFIDEQIRQLGFLTVAKRLPAPFKGESVQSLVAYMKRNGYRFANPDPGGEQTYQALFLVMRDVFREQRPVGFGN